MTSSQPELDFPNLPVSVLLGGLERGTLVRDPCGRVGEYSGQCDGQIWLRPRGGGREWSADPVECRLAEEKSGMEQQLRARALDTRINTAGRAAS